MLLRVTNGTTTVTLDDNSGSPTTPLLGAVYFPRDPGAQDMVTESARVAFSGAVATLRGVTNDIERLLREASDPNAPDVYVEYRPTDSGDVYRSPLSSDSRLTWSEVKAARQMQSTSTSGEFTLVIVRANYWEGPEEELGSATIKNGTTSPYNIVALTAPSGTLPAPLSIVTENAAGATITARSYYFNVDAYVGMTTNQHLLTSPTTSGITGGTLYIFDVPYAVLSKWGGRDAHVMLALSSLFTGYLWVAVYSTIGGVYAEQYHGAERYIAAKELIDLGAVPLPPGGRANTSVAVVVGVYDPSSLSVSFLQIAPAANGLQLHQSGYNTPVDWGVAEDGIEREAWFGITSTRYDIVRRVGGPLLVYPDRASRLHVLFDESGGSFVETRGTTVTATVRPRRATI